MACCLRDATLRMPVPGLTVAFGFSGHGFGISPAVSIALSELILNGKSTTIDISQLNYDRFKAKG